MFSPFTHANISLRANVSVITAQSGLKSKCQLFWDTHILLSVRTKVKFNNHFQWVSQEGSKWVYKVCGTSAKLGMTAEVWYWWINDTDNCKILSKGRQKATSLNNCILHAVTKIALALRLFCMPSVAETQSLFSKYNSWSSLKSLASKRSHWNILTSCNYVDAKRKLTLWKIIYSCYFLSLL